MEGQSTMHVGFAQTERPLLGLWLGDNDLRTSAWTTSDGNTVDRCCSVEVLHPVGWHLDGLTGHHAMSRFAKKKMFDKRMNVV